MSASILVGDPGCTFQQISEYIKTNNLRDSVIPKLLDVCTSLGMPANKRSQATQKIFLNEDLSPVSQFIEYLGEWRQVNSKSATFETLCAAFRTNGLNDFANGLLEQFSGIQREESNIQGKIQQDNEVNDRLLEMTKREEQLTIREKMVEERERNVGEREKQVEKRERHASEREESLMQREEK